VTVRQQQPAKRKKQRKARPDAIPLDTLALQVLEKLMRSFDRGGYSVEDVARQCRILARSFQSHRQLGRNDAGVSRDPWFQILGLWARDPDYVDAEGRPLALRLRGAAPSIEALLKEVGSKLSPDTACNQLVSTGVARKEGGRLVAIEHAPIVFPPGSAEQSAYHLQLLHSVLLNIEHNAVSPEGSLWVERQAICHNFPTSALGAYSVAMTKRAQNFLESEDATMHRIASFAQSTDQPMQATVHIFYSARKTVSSDDPSISHPDYRAQPPRGIQPRAVRTRPTRKSRS
jgi:hypothetical protein